MATKNPYLSDYTAPILADFYGTRPEVPELKPMAGENVGQAITLGTQALSQLPGYQKILGQIGSNLESETRGELPQDVVNQLAQRAAERGVATGSPGSPSSSAGLLRDLGLTSLDLTGRGAAGFKDILPSLPGYGLSQNAGMYISPGQQYERDLQANIFAAAPEPAFAAANAVGNVKSGYNFGYGSGGGYSGFQPGAGMTSSDEWWNAKPGPAQVAVGALPNVGWGGGGGGGGDVMSILNKYNPISGGAANPQRDEWAGVDNAYNFGSEYNYDTDPYWGQFGEG